MQTYYPPTGQIYTETTAPSTRSMTCTWKRNRTGRPLDPSTYKNDGRGVSRLKNMALRACCWNAGLFLPEALEWAGWWYARMVWRGLRERDAATFEAWAIFQQAFPEQAELSHHFRVARQDVLSGWESIVDSLSRLDKAVCTIFCARGLDLDSRQLVLLTGVSSLKTLVLVPPQQGRGGSGEKKHIRDWARAASEKKALPNLKVLYMEAVSDDAAQDAMVLKYLSVLPALALVGFERTHNSVSIAGHYGEWECANVGQHLEFTDMIQGRGTYRQHPLAERVRRLHDLARKISPTSSAKSGVEGSTDAEEQEQVRLSMTCYGDAGIGRNCDVSWYIRKDFSTHVLPRWALASEEIVGGGAKGVKKRKIRTGKGKDVGMLLGEFG